jgi:DNA-binding CsgD family transcriptional regulator
MVQKQFYPYSKHASSVKDIITPMHVMGIAGLFYVRIYPNGTIINLANNANWTEFYFKQLETTRYQSKDINDQFFTYDGISLWAFNAANPIWQDAKQYFGYSNGVLICENHTHFREVIGFYSAENEQRMNHFYANQIDTLKKLKQSFTFQAQELIVQAESERQTWQHAVFPEFALGLSETTRQNLNSSLAHEGLQVVIHKETLTPIQLSPQRSRCLYYLLQGKSCQKIADAMRLSPKTVEHYLEILRKELGCCSSKELIIHYAHQIRQ